MSYKWPDKDKDELLDYNIDWSRFLGADSFKVHILILLLQLD
jgi:hypothetical protein